MIYRLIKDILHKMSGYWVYKILLYGYRICKIKCIMKIMLVMQNMKQVILYLKL